MPPSSLKTCGRSSETLYIGEVQISKKLKNVQVAQTFIYLFGKIVKRKTLMLIKSFKFVCMPASKLIPMVRRISRYDSMCY